MKIPANKVPAQVWAEKEMRMSSRTRPILYPGNVPR